MWQRKSKYHIEHTSGEFTITKSFSKGDVTYMLFKRNEPIDTFDNCADAIVYQRENYDRRGNSKTNTQGTSAS